MRFRNRAKMHLQGHWNRDALSALLTLRSPVQDTRPRSQRTLKEECHGADARDHSYQPNTHSLVHEPLLRADA